jgi:transcriptional regulator with PAS, ATPase and Fis domain
MVFDAVSLHDSHVLSMSSFLEAIGREAPPEPADAAERNPFAALQRLPSFDEALELLVREAMARAGGNQTLAARLLGISQPALSKRLKGYRS